MKSTTITIALLTVFSSALLLDAFCVIEWIGKDCNSHVAPINCACNDKDRYLSEREGAGNYISTDDAQAYLENFTELYKVPQSGGFISKRALDNIFCNDPRANGIFCYFGLTTKEASSFVLLVEKGTNDQTKIRNGHSEESSVFKGEVICPLICGDTPHH